MVFVENDDPQLIFFSNRIFTTLKFKHQNCVYLVAQRRKLWTKTSRVYRRCCKRYFSKAFKYQRRGEMSKSVSELCKIFWAEM